MLLQKEKGEMKIRFKHIVSEGIESYHGKNA